VDVLLCCGDFQAVRNQDDLRNLCAPEKYLYVHLWHLLASAWANVSAGT
jgi:lariat debranching enzyme